ncbi:conjugal transfer protein TrbE [Escherichia coli]|uniref:conjugal transfer protein TrbE n=1 Tax=Escherichia coli TaxID=562 RepID=UPI001DA42D71|nr:conjugal transfer protein TrbE [Escherichia coli]EFU2089818.1 conjugal transfer protein TrbE [Escherichia coli]EIF6907611.1 conjugal transfer protein TrbE [Escherichia coli]
MKVIFTSNRLVDFLIRLSITAIVISPVIIWSWDTVKETTADGMLAAAFVILYSGVLEPPRESWRLNFLRKR